MNKLKLHGFNNLTKSLSFNIFDICYAQSAKHRREYIEYIDEAYNSERLTEILTQVSETIGATILNIAKQDYEPQGASVTMLIAEGPVNEQMAYEKVLTPQTTVAHLDKSHLTVHTYPESHPDNGLSTFRVDIDVSTCGVISPLKALNNLINSFDSDIVTMDYRVRGFTRDINGQKLFIDHNIDSIQNYIHPDIQKKYQMIDVNVYQENIFHTKMLIKDYDLDNYLFGTGKEALNVLEEQEINSRLRREMLEIFYGRNVHNDFV